MRSKPRSHRLGLTLIELSISVAISAFLVLAAVTLSADHSRLLGLTTDRIEAHQEARLALDLLAFDARHAGVGIGYRPSGWFEGMTRGSFTVEGGARFESNNRRIELASGPTITDDLGLRIANGDTRTIADFDSNSGQMCSGSVFANGDLVSFISREGLYSTTARVKIGRAHV